MNINHFSETVIAVPNTGFGQGDGALCLRMSATYFRTLLETGQLPKAILFYTAGVKLLTADSPCLPELKELATAGVPILACRTCLEYYDLVSQLAVGEISNMAAVVEMQGAAARIITL